MYENSYIPQVLSKLSVKVICKSGNGGSGILYRLTKSKEFICVITAAHCLRNDIGGISGLLDISIKRGDLIYNLILTDRVLIHHTADFAVLLCPAEDLDLLFGEIPQLVLAEDNSGELDTLFYGYPDSVLEGAPTRVNTILIPPITDGIILLESTLKSETNLTENTLTGFSGSGVALKCAGNIYLIGVVVQITEWNRFKGLGIKFFNEILTVHKLPLEPISLLEADPELIRSYSLLKKNSNALFAGINETIGTIHIPRHAAIQSACEKLEIANVLIITGLAGIGKSTFAKEFISHLEATNNAKVISFYGSQICKLNFVELLGQFGIANDIGELLKSRDLSGSKIIYIDSAEKAFENNQLDVLKAILSLSAEYSDLKVILSIRSYALTLTTFGLLGSIPVKTERLIVELLNDEEMLTVTQAHSRLTPLLANHKIASFVRTPFYLNLILNMLDEFEGIELNEQLLKTKLWDYIIKKNNIRRELAFEHIALKRAEAMEPFIFLSGDEDPESIKSLLFDHIVNENKDIFGISQYAPSHDIFEDWALVRNTQMEFQSAPEIYSFFNGIGHSYAKRRGFRFWLQEMFRIDAEKAQQITLNTLGNANINDSWKDEVIIVFLNAVDCQDFLSMNEAILLANGAAMFKRCIHLVRTSCKEPGARREPEHFLDEKAFMTSDTMLPSGPGWGALINFIAKHPDVLTVHRGLIIGFLSDWGKLAPLKQRPASIDAAGVIFKLIHGLNQAYNKSRDELDEQRLQALIVILFNLTQDNEAIISKFIAKSFQFVKLNTDKINGNSTLKEVQNLSFHKKVFSLCVDYRYSEMLCRFLPGPMWDILIYDWIAPNQVKRKPQTYAPPHFRSLLQSRKPEPEELFGFKRHSRRDYSPVSALQTPLPHLLKYHQEEALLRVIEILNGATIKYSKSPYAELEVITIVLDGKRKVKQFGSELFWRMYRGVMQMPELAECLLMAIENYLLSLAAKKSAVDNETLLKSIDLLYEKSVTVATTSVIASISMAHPLLVGDRVIPLFTFKEAFQWDFQRWSKEREIFTLPDVRGEKPGVQQERVISKQLEHRKVRLEFLAFKMSLYEAFSPRILNLVDGYQKKINQKVLAKFPNWQFVLNKIDKRQYKVTSTTKEGIILEAVLPDELQKKADLISEELGDMAGIDLWNWCHTIIDKSELTDLTIEKWRFYKNLVDQLSGVDTMDSAMYNVPAGVAAIGLEHTWDKLNTVEKEWCINTIIEVSEFFLAEELRQFSPGMGKYPDWNKQPAYTHLPMLLNFVSEELRLKVSSLVKRILQITGIDNGNDKPIFESIARNCWSTDIVFAKQCFNELIFIAVKPGWKYGSLMDELVPSMPELKFINDHNAEYYLDKAFLFISEAAAIDSDGLEFLMAYQDFLFEKHVEKKARRGFGEERDYYHGTINFQFKYGQVMLGQEHTISAPLFSKLIDYLTAGKPEQLRLISNEGIQMVLQCFKDIFGYEDKYWHTDRFFELWRILSSKTITTGRLVFLQFLLLDWYWRDDSTSWPLIKQHKLFFCGILKLLGTYDINRSITLMAGIGFDDLFPESLELFLDIVKTAKDNSWALRYDAEKYVQRSFYLKGNVIRSNQQYKVNFLLILDQMIQGGSSIAYLIKESIVSL